MARPRIRPSSNAARASSICSKEYRLITSFSRGNLVLTHPHQEQREVGIGFCGTETPAVVALIEQNVVQIEGDIGDRNPDKDRHATLVVSPWSSLPDCVEYLESRFHRTDCVEGVVDAARVDLPNRVGRVTFRRIETLGSAELSGKLQLTVV